MKQKLLLALLALFTLGGSNLFAQTTWTGVSEITSGEEYYIVNDATGLFLTPGNNWGTRATLDESPAGTATVTLADGKYTIVFTWPSGGNGLFVDSDDGNNIFCDRNNQANYFWTIDSNGDNTFTLQLASDQARYKEGSYLTAESRDIWANVQYNSSNEDLRKWRFISPKEVKETMLNSEESLDVSLFVHGAQGTNNIAASNNSFDRFKERYSWNIVGGNWKGQNNQTLEGFNKYWMEAWSGQALTNRSATKTINDMPEGHYKVSAYTVGGNGVDWFAQVGSAEKVTKTTAGGNPALTSVEIDVTESSNITLGIQSSSNTNVGWIAFDNVKLEYTSFKKNYTEKLAEAEALAESLSGKVPTPVLNALLATINDNKDITSGYLEAAAALTSAMEAANSFVAPYARYISVRDAVLAINADIDLSTANSKANEAITTEDINAAVATARTALANYLSYAQLDEGETIDLTAALIDNAAPGESGNVLYWDASGNVGYGSNLCEYYGQEGATIKQAITILPKGNFKLTAVGFTRTGYNAELFAGENSTNIATVASSEVNGLQTGNTWINNGNGVTNLVFNLANTTEGLEIGLKADTQGDKWMVWRSFSLVYGDVFEPYTLAEGKMNAGVATAQSTAENNYKTNPSPATYQALMDAIAAAQASAKAYEDMTTAVTKIDAALEAATSATASAEAYNTIKSAYDEGTIADADIMTKVVEAYNAVIPVIKSQTAAQADFTLAIQNQSFEYGNMTGWTATSSSDTGVRETSNATYTATGSDGKYLFNTWWQGVPLTQAVTDLPNGEYTLTVSVASDGGTIYLLANGEHNEGIETYATTDAEQGQYSKDTFQETTFTFLVKDGNATIGVVGGADGTAGEHKDYVEAGYWWYKADNFRLVKNRELTPEEQAVTPTGITLDKTEVTLTATDNSVTLTPTFDPENATTTVTWTTSDANIATVADGVVTGVAPGTATITVASTLNADVKATCTVTVSYPESTVPETYYENDGATRTVYTLGENLIKNGSFEYPNPVYAWTASSNYSTAALASNFTINTTGGMYDGAYLTGNGVGAADQKSLTKLIPVESGKTYYFSVYTSGKAPNASNQNYNALFKLTNEKKEDGTITKFNWPQGADKETSDWNKTEFIFTADESHPYVGIRLSWAAGAKFDEFILAEVNATTEGNVDYVIDAIPTANIGDKPFQYSQSAIDAANALVQGEATVEDVENAYAAVTTVNAPAEGQLFNVVLTYNGWTYDNKAMTYIANGRTDAGNYNIQYKEVANENLAQAFTFTKVEGNNYKMSQIDADGVARYISTGVPYSGNTSQIRTTTNADDALLVTVIPTATEGKWNLRNTAANQYIGSQDAGVYTVNSHIDFVLQEAQKPSNTINTTAAGWGTTILPFAVNEIPEGVKVYSCAEVNGSTLTLAEVDALEANKPYIIEGAWNATLTGDAQGTALTYTDGLLTGTYERIAAPNGSYVLQKHDDKVGFFKVDTSVKQPYVPANRAYLTVSNSSAKAFYFGGDATGISAIEALMNGDAEIYNVSGVKQNTLQKGINIIKTADGKTHKIMVK